MKPIYLRLLKSVSVHMGMVLLGAAMAFAISLALLQDAAMAQNVWPTVYSPEQGSHIYAAGKELQLLANASGIGGAVLLLAYGLLDRFEDGEPNLTESSGGVVDD